MAKISSNDLKRGVYFLFRGEPYQVLDFKHSYIGRGSAHVRVKIKNLKSGKVLSHTFRAGEQVEEAEVVVRDMQYLYTAGNECFFMDNKTYDQVSLSKKVLGDVIDFLKEGQLCQVLSMNDLPVNIRPPKKVTLKVIESAEAAKGNTATAATKTVKLETGINVSVPLFIKQGDMLVINPETGEYVERAG